MNEAAMIIAGAVACLGLSAAGSAFGTGFAATAAVGAWKKGGQFSAEDVCGGVAHKPYAHKQ